MKLDKNTSLLPYNTFHIDAYAKFLLHCNTIADLQNVASDKLFEKEQKLIIGGGSNLLITGDFNGLVIRNEIKGIEIIKEDSNYVYVKAGGGEVWHDFVLYCVNNGFGGPENMSLIPGSVGAGPIQNIGAYGTELKDVLFELEAYHFPTNTIHKFSLEDCEFGYRESVFKNKLKGTYMITSVTYRLNKIPQYKIKYGAIEKELERMGVKDLNLKAVSEAVCNIRNSKLPDPFKIGNAGSFFKNPVVTTAHIEKLKSEYPDIVSYPQDAAHVKLAAGWLIEKSGWKGYREGDAGVHKDQALVLVNYGSAKGKDILALADKIVKSVKEKFNVDLDKEVNII